MKVLFDASEPFKAQWLLYVPPTLTLKIPKFCPLGTRIYVFPVILRISSDYFLNVH